MPAKKKAKKKAGKRKYSGRNASLKMPKGPAAQNEPYPAVDPYLQTR